MTRVSTNELINKINLNHNIDRIDIIVSFLKHSGLKLFYPIFDFCALNNITVRIITSTYLSLTEPAALYELNEYFPNQVKIYNGTAPSFHPKAYFFHMKDVRQSFVFIGSSNMSHPGLVDGVEWNYRIDYSIDSTSFEDLQNEFNQIFEKQSEIANEEIIDNYSRSYKENERIHKLMNEHYLSLSKYKKESRQDKMFIPNSAQLETLYKLSQTRKIGFTKALVVLATGVGKTVLSALDSLSTKSEKILFVAHRKEILYQAERTYSSIHSDKSTSFMVDGTVDYTGDIVFASVMTLNSRYQEIDKNHFNYIVIDEVHHAIAKSYEKIINYFEPKFCVGLTATPYRLDGQDIFKLFEYNLVHEISLFEAINRDLLTPIDYRGIYDGTVKYEYIEYVNGKYNEESLSLALMTQQRADLILSNYLKHHRNRTLAFCSSLKHAQYMAEHFNSKGIKSVVVGSDSSLTHYEDRKRAIERITYDISHDDNIKVIFSVDIFNEGVDIPSIDCILMLRPTESPVVFAQQIGRGLRKFNSKVNCLVLDFIGNYKKLDMLPKLLNIPLQKYDNNIEKALSHFQTPLLSNIEFELEVINIMDSFLKKDLAIKERFDSLLREKYQSNRKSKPLTRVEFFSTLTLEEYTTIKSIPAINPFNNYVKFLESVEKDYLSSFTKEVLEFINKVETTSMTRMYKIPVLRSFIKDSRFIKSVSLSEIQTTFKSFYSDVINYSDIKNQKNVTDLVLIGNAQARIIITNPIKYLCQSINEINYDSASKVLSIDIPDDHLNSSEFIEQYIDILNFRELEYRTTRLDKRIRS